MPRASAWNNAPVCSDGSLIVGLSFRNGVRMSINIAFERYRLSNGLEVILHEDHAIPMAAVNVWYHVGSQNEEPDRTGFAHLFEHIMFKGSKHHAREYFMPLQEVGANVNGSTSTDRTNYYENVPAEYLELALWLESDRMGYLLDALDQASFDVEREVVKNERRQSYENRPYGLAGQEIRRALFPPNHPYHWQTIGSQEHLDAASLEDVKAFFRRYYAPNNASLAIAGDIDVEDTKQLVEKYFADLPPAPSAPRIERWMPALGGEVRIGLEDQVQLNRLYLAWVGPQRFDPDEAPLEVLASILGEGRSSRLYRSLVYEKRVAREANARFGSMEVAGEFRLDATIVPGADVAEAEGALLAEIERLRIEPPTDEEIGRAVNRLEARHVRQLESIGGFGGRANLLNYFNVFAGDPGRLNSDFDRYLAVTPGDVQRVARTYLGPGRVRLLVVPKPAVSPSPTSIDRTQQPSPGRPRAFRPPVPQRLHLGGGLDLLVVEKRELPTVAAAVYFPGGALRDATDAPGLSAFTVRLLTEGTRSRSSRQIAEENDSIAARLNVHAHREYDAATTEVLTRHWPRARDLLADVLTNANFPAHEVERVRKEWMTDLRRLRDDANAIADRVSTGVLFGRDTPQGHPTNGREDAIAALARAALVDHHEQSILRGRPTFVLVGDIDAQNAARELEDAFGSWGRRVERPSVQDPGGSGREGVSVTGAVPSNSDRSSTGARELGRPTTIYLVDKPGAAQSVILANQVSASRVDPDYLPLVIMNMTFGGQFTARLNMNLRQDKGYTYGYRSGFDWRLGRSRFSAGGAVHTAVTREALIETLKEFRDVHAERPISEDEFTKARLGLIRGYPPTFETTGQILGRLMDLVHFELADDYYRGQIERLQSVTLAEVQRVAAEYVDPDRLSIVVVGDRAVIERGLEALELPIIHLNHEGEAVS
ncbi:MAG: insulinase family protein [Chloroflexi bacterium]|nr:insulinase family protein [Chloroflexota bacterium]